MGFLKRLLRKKKSTSSKKSTEEATLSSGSQIKDSPKADSLQAGGSHSNSNSSSLLKEIPRKERKPTDPTATPAASRGTSRFLARCLKRDSTPVLSSKPEELKAAGHPTLCINKIIGSFENELHLLDTKTRGIITAELDATAAWKALAEKIPHPDRPSEPLFTDLNLDNKSKKFKSITGEILRVWSTTGSKRPRIQDLYNLLIEINELKIAQRLEYEVRGNVTS